MLSLKVMYSQTASGNISKQMEEKLRFTDSRDLLANFNEWNYEF